MTASDPCFLFVRLLENNQTRTNIWIHVDDAIAASTHENELDYHRENLKQKFKIITAHDFTKDLGINVEKL
jgi:Fe-S cluster assembly iron-binding protein IscA